MKTMIILILIHHHRVPSGFLSFLFKRFYLFIFGERGREGDRENIIVSVASYTCPNRDLACNPGMCPDWESNP